jgi:predicted Zn-dependent protease
MLAAVVLVLGSVALANRSAARYRWVTVRYGDTVWSIAASHVDAGADPRAAVDAIVDDNDLASATIVPGERLKLRQ